MKRQWTSILTAGVALVLIGSIAYAADRRKQARLLSGSSPEEESLRAELLAAVNDNDKKSPGSGNSGKFTGNKRGGKAGQTKSKL